MHTIIVLTDGETWNTMHGCRLMVITKEDFEDLCVGFKEVNDIVPVSEVVLCDTE